MLVQKINSAILCQPTFMCNAELGGDANEENGNGCDSVVAQSPRCE